MIINLLILFIFSSIISIYSQDTTSTLSCSPSTITLGTSTTCTFLPKVSNTGISITIKNITLSSTGINNNAVATGKYTTVTLIEANTYTFIFTPSLSDYYTIKASTNNITISTSLIVITTPDETSLLTCDSSVYIGSNVPNVNGFVVVTLSSYFTISSSMTAPRIRSYIPIGTFTAWNTSVGSTFMTIGTTNQTGTWAVTDGVDTGCSVIVYSSQFITLMPYSNSQNLFWVVSVPTIYTGALIQFWFTQFQTEPSTLCTSDFAAIYLGNISSTVGKTPLYTFCGGETDITTALWSYHTPSGDLYALNYVFYLNTTAITLYFQSDYSVTYNGIQFGYDFTYNITYPPDPTVPPQAPKNSYTQLNSTTSTASNQYKGYVLGDYLTYLITSPAVGSIINLQFSWFDLADSIYCDSDRIVIYDGKDKTGTVLATICGGSASFQLSTKYHSDFGQTYTLASSFNSTSNNLFIEFITASSTPSTGYVFKYYNLLPSVLVNGVISNLTQPIGLSISKNYLVLPPLFFANALTLPDASLTYTFSAPSFSSLPSFLTFDLTTLSLSGTFPLSWSGTLFLTITATNYYGYSASAAWTINTIVIEPPDSTSIFSCISTQIQLTSSNVDPVSCIFYAKKDGSPTLTLAAYLFPVLNYLPDGSASTGAVGTISLIDAQDVLAYSFNVPYIPEPSGGLAIISSGIKGVANISLTINAATDNTSSVTCSPMVVSVGALVTCVVEPKYYYAPVYTTVPFTLLGASIASPYLDSTAAERVTFSSYTTTDGFTYTFTFTAGSISCYYPVCISATNCVSPIVVVSADATSQIQCSQTKTSPGLNLPCYAYPRLNNKKVCSLASDFKIYSSEPSSTIVFLNTAGPLISFYFKTAATSGISLTSHATVLSSLHSIKLASTSPSLTLGVNGANSTSTQDLSVIPGPDATSSLTCATSATKGSTTYCTIVARINDVISNVLTSSFTPTILSGSAILSSVVQWRVSVQDPDNLVSQFQFSVQLLTTTDSVTVSDGRSGLSQTIVGTSDPDNAILLDCSTSLSMLSSSNITCSYQPTANNVVVSTFTSRFSISVLQTISNVNYGVVSILTAYDANDNVTTNAAQLIKFTFFSPPTSVQSSLLLTTFRPNGDAASSTTITVNILDVPDSTSSLSCVSQTFTAYSPVVCSIIPRKNGVVIFASNTYFKPTILTGTGSVTTITPTSSNLLYFRVTIPQSYTTAIVSDSFSSNTVTITTEAPSLVYSWAESNSFPNSLILTSLGRPNGESLTGIYGLSVGTRVSGKERLDQIACGINAEYCIAVTSVGSVVSWGVQSSVHLGRDDLAGTNFTPLDTVIYTLQNIFATAVGVINTGSASTAWNFVLTREGNLYSWGDPTSSPTYFSTSSLLSFKPVNIPLTYPLKFMSNKGSTLLGVDANNTVYSWGSSVFQLGRAGTRDIPLPVTIKVNRTATTWSTLGSVTHLLTGTNYSVVITDSKRWFSWGSGLFNTYLPSDTLASESVIPFALIDPIVKIDGNDICLVVLTASGTLHYMTLDYLISGSISSKNAWETVTSTSITVPAMNLLSVGVSRVLTGDANGNLYAWDTATTTASTYSNIASIVGPTGGVNCTTLYISTSSFCAASPPTVTISKKTSYSCCGNGCYSCSTLSNALSNYVMWGTTFQFESSATPHQINGTVGNSTYIDIRLMALGNSSFDKYTIDCMGEKCFNLPGNGIIFDGLIFTNGLSSDGGGFISVISNQLIYLKNLLIQNMISKQSGGAIYNNGQIVINNVSFRNNTAVLSGGAIYTADSGISGNLPAKIITSNVTFESNSALVSGGAVEVETTVIFATSTFFISNTAPQGAGIDADILSLICSNCAFQFNVATNGGAAYLTESTATFNYSNFISNTGSSYGGGLYVSFSTVSVNNCNFSYNSAPVSGLGGGIYAMGNYPIVLYKSFFDSNYASASGGAIATIFCTPELSYSTFRNNSAVNGGAIFVGLQASILSLGSQFIFNKATYGACFAFEYCEASTVSSTLMVSNKATTYGGAIYILGQTNVTIANSNFTLNYAPAGGCIWWDLNFPVQASNVFSQNGAMQGPDIASQPVKLVFSHVWPPSYEANSGAALDYSLSVKLLDYYNQIVAVDSTTSVSVSSSQIGVSLIGQLTGTLTAGQLNFTNVAIGAAPSYPALVYVSGFFAGIGVFSTSQFSIAIRDCLPGEYNINLRCVTCVPGKYSNVVGTTSCLFCALGKYSLVYNSTACVDCSPGTYSPSQAATSCYSCEKGSFASSYALSTCSLCTAGSYAQFTQSSYCDTCQTGTYSNPGQALCTTCNVGYYTNSTGSIICTKCADGYYQSNTGSSFCSLCLAGGYSTGIACPPSPEGTYSKYAGATSVSTCWPNSVTDPDKAWCSCYLDNYEVRYDDNVKLKYLNVESSDNVTICTKCPAGADCKNTNTSSYTVKPLVNYWPEPKGTNTKFFKCVSTNCVGGSQVCAAGYYGPMCTVCIKGLGRANEYDCEICPPDATNKAYIFVGMIILICINSFMIYSTINAEKAEVHSVLFKILMSGLQFNSLALNFQFQFPDFVNSLFGAQKSSGQVANAFINLDCLFGNDFNPPTFYIKTLMYFFIVPFIFIAPAIVFYPMYLSEAAKRRSKEAKDEVAESYKNKYITAVIIGLFLQHPAIAQQTLYMFACVETGYDTKDSVLLLDMRQSCTSESYYMWRNALAIPMLLFYVIGIPAVAMKLMSQHSHELDAPHIRARYQFLYGGYIEEKYYWELVIIIRKVVMIFIIVFFYSTPNFQALAGVLLIVVFAIAHLLNQPYEIPLMDNIEMLSLATSFTTFYCGLFLFAPEGLDRNSAVAISIIIVLINIVFICICLYQFYLIIKNKQIMEAAKFFGEEDVGHVQPESLRQKQKDSDYVNRTDDLAFQMRNMQINLQQRDRDALINNKRNSTDGRTGEFDQTNILHDDGIELTGIEPVLPLEGYYRIIMRFNDLSEESIKQDIDEFSHALWEDLVLILNVDPIRFKIGQIKTRSKDQTEIEVILSPNPENSEDISSENLARKFQGLIINDDITLNNPDLSLIPLLIRDKVKIYPMDEGKSKGSSTKKFLKQK